MATPDVKAQLAQLEASLDAAAAARAADAARIAELEAEVLDPTEVAVLDRIVQKAATLAPPPLTSPAA